VNVFPLPHAIERQKMLLTRLPQAAATRFLFQVLIEIPKFQIAEKVAPLIQKRFVPPIGLRNAAK
jgi:hypothetical protein